MTSKSGEVAKAEDEATGLQTAMANVTTLVAEVSNRLIEKYRSSESEVERLRHLSETQTLQYAEEIESLKQKLECSNRELAKVTDALKHSTESVRTLSDLVKQLKLGISIEKDRHASLELSR